MTIAAIVVTDTRNAIGKDNKLLCHLPADLKFFKSTTMGFPIIEGRKTYESVGRLLPGRRNIVITRSSDYRIEGAEIYHSIEKALAACTEEMVFIIGGAEIFRQSLSHITVIYRTLIRHEFEADTWFPSFEKEFKMVSQECFEADAKNPYAYCFEKWVRK
jgi:dihydrofolate reductase